MVCNFVKVLFELLADSNLKTGRATARHRPADGAVAVAIAAAHAVCPRRGVPEPTPAAARSCHPREGNRRQQRRHRCAAGRARRA